MSRGAAETLKKAEKYVEAEEGASNRLTVMLQVVRRDTGAACAR